MGSNDRFYLMEMRNRPVKYGDIGSLVKISGLLLTGGGSAQVLMLPGISESIPARVDVPWEELTAEEWSDFIRRSDDPEILVGPAKIFQRKVRYEISGSVQQKCWVADGFKCHYCDAKMGDALMTIDHYHPLELGGKNDVTNCLTACRKCNKDKGSQDPVEWMNSKGWNGKEANEVLLAYLKNRVIK